jgi:multidrug transporter EmrE-like cation transporter
MWIFFLLLLVLFEAAADILVKEWTLRSLWPWALGAFIVYLLANAFWMLSMKNGVGLGRGAVLFSILSGILGILIGVILYKEPVSRFQMLGLTFGMVSIFFFAIHE